MLRKEIAEKRLRSRAISVLKRLTNFYIKHHGRLFPSELYQLFPGLSRLEVREAWYILVEAIKLIQQQGYVYLDWWKKTHGSFVVGNEHATQLISLCMCLEQGSRAEPVKTTVH